MDTPGPTGQDRIKRVRRPGRTPAEDPFEGPGSTGPAKRPAGRVTGRATGSQTGSGDGLGVGPTVISSNLLRKLEAPPGFEPGVEVLQFSGRPRNVSEFAKDYGLSPPTRHYQIG